METTDGAKDRVRVSVRINGQEHHLEVDARTTTLELLREHLHQTGAKLSCGEQRCGACTVLVGGLPISSCTYLAYELDGAEVLTIEGLAANGELDTLQRTFIEEGAVQCGFCTPGMILTARALLNDFDHPSDADIREALAGNLCRCTGYEAILRAVQKARDAEAE
jgi:aerobic carbon-monoxide dehydrogenase small subunit